jgi:CopG antitoxin of type II toxin-antitoxin system
VVGVNTTTVRLPERLRERVRAHARAERRSFSNAVRVLIEAGLDAGSVQPDVDVVDEDEVERLADIARHALGERGIYGPNAPPPPFPFPPSSPPDGGG